jgi:hypothetical protein
MRYLNENLKDNTYTLYDRGVHIRSSQLNSEEVVILNYAYGLNGSTKKWKLNE